MLYCLERSSYLFNSTLLRSNSIRSICLFSGRKWWNW